MNRRWFTLSVPTEIMRGMTREQVYATRRWLRVVARVMAMKVAA